nr:titin homolog isoform X2 [Ipomoea batatas]
MSNDTPLPTNVSMLNIGSRCSHSKFPKLSRCSSPSLASKPSTASLLFFRQLVATMAGHQAFTAVEMAVDEGLGYPKAYAKLCKDPSLSPPFTFVPSAPTKGSRAKELDEMFPIVDPNAKPAIKPKMFVSLLWKQLNHLGNAGFDPDMFRIDPYGNVVYYHADSASPLAWGIDHWFPISRGGLTVPRNLRILQWQVCKKKHNQLEFLIPWWDLQVGISINQFLSIFASSNSDFRHRAFSCLFSEGESEELNTSQTGIGCVAPAAVVLARRESRDTSSALKSLDINRRPRSCIPIIASKKLNSDLKENEDPGTGSNPYEAIVIARNSLRQWEETAKMQAEIQKLDDEESKLKQKAEEAEMVSVEDLELILMKKRRHAEKCRKLAEAQTSYKAMLKKMIRDAVHQSVVYEEQVSLNQVASKSLMARLEAQRAICNSAEKELHYKYKQRDELEKQVRPDCEQPRKRSRLDDFLEENNVFYSPVRTQLQMEMDDALAEKDGNMMLCLPGRDSKDSVHKELRAFLMEEQKASLPAQQLSAIEEQEAVYGISTEEPEEHGKAIVVEKNENGVEEILENLEMQGGTPCKFQFPVFNESENETAEIDKVCRTDEIIEKLNLKYPHIEIKSSSIQEPNQQLGVENESNTDEMKEPSLRPDNAVCKDTFAKEALKHSQQTPSRKPPYRVWPRKSNADERHSDAFDDEHERKSERGRKLTSSESGGGAVRLIPSSPSLILSSMKKRGKKPSVTSGSDADEDRAAGNSNFIKSSIKTIIKAVKI